MKRKINDTLIIKYILGETDPEERKLVHHWLSTDKDNRKRYDHFNLIWQISRSHAKENDIDVNVAWDTFKKNVDQTPRAGSEHKKSIEFMPFLKVAAAVILISIGLWGVYSLFTNIFSENLTSLHSDFDRRSYILNDSSEIFLNKNTEVQVPMRFARDNRTIHLIKGELFLNVYPDRSKPFIVTTDDIEIKVVGTSFNIKNYDGITEIIVESGLVEVYKDQEMVSLEPNEMVEINKKSVRLEKGPVNDQLYKYYRINKFIADDTPLYRVVKVLNEAYDAHIILADEDLEKLPLNSSFKNMPLDSIINIICETLQIKKEVKGEKILLYK